jgi:hypothetical protein
MTVLTRLRAVLATRPEIWFVPSVLIALVTSFTSVGQAVLGPAVIRRLAFVTPDPILPFTLAAGVLFGGATYVRVSRRGTLGWPRRLLVALSVPVGAVGLFEIPYQAIRDAVYPATYAPALGYHPWLALACWVVVGFTGLGLWAWSPRIAALALATGTGFALWWAVGFPQATSGDPGQALLGYLFNVPLKFACFGLYGLPLLGQGAGSRNRSGASGGPSTVAGPESGRSRGESG